MPESNQPPNWEQFVPVVKVEQVHPDGSVTLIGSNGVRQKAVINPEYAALDKHTPVGQVIGPGGVVIAEIYDTSNEP